MHRLFILIAFFFNFMGLNGQSVSVKGIITDSDTNTPLPYATIVVIHLKTGTIADKNGNFEISVPEANLLSDTLEFSHLGYNRIKVPVNKFLKDKQGQVGLKVNPTALNDVVVVPKKYKVVKVGVFAKKPQGYNVVSVFQHRKGNFVENKAKKQGWIKSVSFYIRPEGHPETPFRVRVMDVDQEKGCPDNDLLNENVIVAAKAPGWFKIDLEKYNIVFPKDGAFVMMEWINSGDQYYYTFELPQCNADGEVTKRTGSYYGQVIGTVNKQPRMVTWGSSLGNEWVPYKMYYKGYPNLMINAEVIFSE